MDTQQDLVESHLENFDDLDYNVAMATFCHWKDGVMDEEYLFWDNQEFMRELGLAT